MFLHSQPKFFFERSSRVGFEKLLLLKSEGYGKAELEEVWIAICPLATQHKIRKVSLG